jgi:hypothetical protein
MHLPAHQRGAALLILLALVSVVLIYAVVAGLNRSAADMAQARAQKTTTALAQAKEALIAYAVTYTDTRDDPGGNSYTVPGFLPCPDLGSFLGEGVAAGNCGSTFVSQLGRLPWRTLDLDALKDGSGECLWYAVSGTYKNNPNGVSGSTNSNMMNWDTNGQFTVSDGNGNTLAGSTEDNRAVAVIFAPGGTLSGQNRTPVAGTNVCGGDPDSPAAYLETANGINNSVVSGTANATSTFIAGTSSSTFNDQLVYITRADIWNAIKKRSDFNDNLRALTRRAAECTRMYGTHNIPGNDMRLPWASNVSVSTTSVQAYAVNANYYDASGALSGRLSFNVNTAKNDTGNDISSSISDYGTTGAYIFTPGSYCSYTAAQKIWYDNWKDQLFYAVANNFRPTTPPGQVGCPTCLTINGSGNYAAVVIFAGEKLSGQSRNTATDKGSIANYLEGSNIVPNTGGGNYQAAATSSSFNDIVYAINNDLKVWCSDASGVMRPLTLGAPSPGPPGDPAAYAACP